MFQVLFLIETKICSLISALRRTFQNLTLHGTGRFSMPFRACKVARDLHSILQTFGQVDQLGTQASEGPLLPSVHLLYASPNLGPHYRLLHVF